MHALLSGRPGERRLLLGNEAIVRGALEAGVALATTYPGTPASEIGDRFYQLSQESDLYFEYSTNEKVALEVAAGAAASGLRAMCSMKHVGVNVAADTLMTLAYSGVKGGLVLVSADDPSLFSSQNEQDNRYYAKLSGLPMLEPANAQEAKDMTSYGFELSERLGLPVILRTTTRINHSRGVVVLGDRGNRTGARAISVKTLSGTSWCRRWPERPTACCWSNKTRRGTRPKSASSTAWPETGPGASSPAA